MDDNKSTPKPIEVRLEPELIAKLGIAHISAPMSGRWLVRDGEWIESGQPIVQVYERYGALQLNSINIVLDEPSEGVLSHSKSTDQHQIASGDLLFSIYEKGLYDGENSLENDIYYYYLNKYKLKKIIDSENTRSEGVNFVHTAFSIYKINRHKIDGSFVRVNDLVATISDFTKSYKIFSNKDGFINYVDSITNTVHLDADELIYSISKDDQTRIDHKYYNTPEIIDDEFSGLKVIKWLVVGGYSSYICTLDTSCSIGLGFTFHFDERDYIVFSFITKELMLSKNNRISFLFENGSIVDFTLSQNSYRSTNQQNKVFENRVPIFDDELLLFANEGLKAWKIKLDKSGREIIGGSNGAGNYQDSSNLKIVVNKLAREYRSLVKEEISGYSPLTKEMEPQGINEIVESDVCFVYLMNDTVNNIHKIGISNNPSWREKTLQSEKPTIELLVAKKFINRKIASSIEKALHDAYSSKRIRGEWFKLDANELTEIIDTLSN